MARDPGLDFSFSGLKTALAYLCRDLGPDGVEESRADLAASFQAAAVGQLTAKLKRALKRGEWSAVALGGGVAANGPLREAVAALCGERGLRLKLVPLELCTDNAAMIGSAARFAPSLPYPDYLTYDAFSEQPPAGWRPMSARLVLYSRPGCHLCEEALAELVDMHRARATASSCARSTSRATRRCCDACSSAFRWSR